MMRFFTKSCIILLMLLLIPPSTKTIHAKDNALQFNRIRRNIGTTNLYKNIEVFDISAKPSIYKESKDDLSDPSHIRDEFNIPRLKKKSVESLEKILIETSSVENDHRMLVEFGNSDITERVAKLKTSEIEDRVEGAAILDEFPTGKMNSPDTGNTLPFFLTEPESAYVVKNRPAVLKCKAAHALQLHFKCSGSSQPPPSTHDKHVDPHTGVFLEEVTATIHRDLVDEYFGKSAFKCECLAWSSRGVVKSQSATIIIAYIRKQFATSPTSLRVELGSRAELYCEPPNGFPEPNVTWYKNNIPLSGGTEHGISISTPGTITFPQVSLQDMANYSCSAENVAGKRVSDSAVLIVYVNGGWSSWSTWKDCKCTGNVSQGRKRLRLCNNPVPINGGSQCSGPQVQKSPDCLSCAEETQIVNTDGFELISNKRLGRWTTWSDWSSCSADCIQFRRRKCITNDVTDDILVGSNGNNPVGTMGFIPQCSGKDIQTAECRGEHCPVGKEDFDWTLYLGLAFITAVCFAGGIAVICCARRVGVGANPPYNIARRVIDSEYIQGVDKKEIRMHMEAANISYDYASPDNRYIPNDHISSGAMSEHHYDVPNLTANYINPIDELSVDYQTDTPDTSTADTCNSTYDAMVKPITVKLSKGSVYETLSSNGGSLSLYSGEVMLHVPEYAIGKNIKKNILLMLLQDDGGRISLPNAENLLICSAVVHCSPRDYSFLKPVIIKIPHCLVQIDNWNVSIYNANSDHEDLNVNWRKIIQVGEETINTPCFVHIEDSHIFIMTEHFGRYVVVAEPKNVIDIHPAIRMKLIAFSQQTPTSTNTSLRIYVIKDFPNSKDVCAGIETQLGGSFQGESEVFVFYLDNNNLNIRIRILENDSNDRTELHEHIIPYNHILNNSSILHCEFTIKRMDHLNAVVEFAQTEGNIYCFSIPSNLVSGKDHVMFDAGIEQRNALISIDHKGAFVSDNLIMGFQLPRTTKRMLCAALDPPREDERDWRLLAKLFNTDRYLAYFATKASPTEQILNLWECRAQLFQHTITDLLVIIKEMNRQDILDIISETSGPLWL